MEKQTESQSEISSELPVIPVLLIGNEYGKNEFLKMTNSSRMIFKNCIVDFKSDIETSDAKLVVYVTYNYNYHYYGDKTVDNIMSFLTKNKTMETPLIFYNFNSGDDVIEEVERRLNNALCVFEFDHVNDTIPSGCGNRYSFWKLFDKIIDDKLDTESQYKKQYTTVCENKRKLIYKLHCKMRTLLKREPVIPGCVTVNASQLFPTILLLLVLTVSMTIYLRTLVEDNIDFIASIVISTLSLFVLFIVFYAVVLPRIHEKVYMVDGGFLYVNSTSWASYRSYSAKYIKDNKVIQFGGNYFSDEYSSDEYSLPKYPTTTGGGY